LGGVMEAQAELLSGDEGGEPWPLPEGWVWTKLGGLGQWVGGGTPSKANPAFWNAGDIPWVSPKDMKVAIIGNTEDKITKEAVELSSAKYVPAGSVLMVMRSGILRHTFPVAVSDRVVTLNQDLRAITPHQNINPAYISRYLTLSSSRIINYCAKDGTTVNSIDAVSLEKFLIPLAPLAEQRRIVARIDTLFAEIATGEAALAEAKKGVETFRKALLKAAVTGELTKDWREQNPVTETGHDLLARIEKTRTTSPVANGRRRRDVDASPIKVSELPCLPRSWAWTTLGEIADVVGGATVDRKRKPVDPITVPYLRVANVQRGRVDLSEVKSITVEQSLAKKLSLKIGDLLLNEGGDRDKIGRGWVWEGSVPLMIHQNHVFRARLLDSSFNPYFFSHYSNELGRRYFIDEGKQTTNLASISLSKITLLPVPVPPPAEAAEILRRVTEALSAADDTLAMLDAEAANAARLKQAILKAAFEGRLVSQDSSDEPTSTLLARLKGEGLASKPARKKRGH
jgi:type I restriction enzyme S subunit